MWDSVLFRTLFDGVVVTATIYFIVIGLRHYHETRRLGFGLATNLILPALAIISLVYLADLFGMHVLPHLTSHAVAMEFITDLHLSWNRIGVLVAVSALASSTYLLQATIPQAAEVINDLAQSRDELAHGLVERENAEAVLRSDNSLLEQQVKERTANLKLAHDNLSEVQRVARLGSWKLDLVNNEMNWSSEIGRILEVEIQGFEISFDSFLSFIHPEDRAYFDWVYAESVENKVPYDIVHRLLLKDGAIKYVSEKCQTFYDENGKPLRSIGTMMDITDRQRMEDELVRLERMQARVELISGLNHNLNNLMNGFVAPAEFLMASEQSEENRRWVEIIQTTAQRAVDLVQRLNDVVSSSKEPLQAVDVNSRLQLSINAARAQWQDDARTRDIDIKLDTDFHSVPPIAATPSELNRVLNTLILNAVDAMPAGGMLTLSTRKEAGGVSISVQDTGIGMSEETKKRVFEPFFTTRHEIGAGLNLYKAYTTIGNWGGEMEVEGKPGEGTIFKIWLPKWTDDHGSPKQMHQMAG